MYGLLILTNIALCVCAKEMFSPGRHLHTHSPSVFQAWHHQGDSVSFIILTSPWSEDKFAQADIKTVQTGSK